MAKKKKAPAPKIDAAEEARRAVENAHQVLRADYYKDVKDTAKDIAQRYRAGEFRDRERLLEDIHQTVDGSARVIYTANAVECLRYSDNDGAGIDSMGADGFDWKDGIPWSALAFFAFEADVIESLGHEGVDVNEDFEVCDTCKKPFADCDILNGECDICTEIRVAKEAKDIEEDQP